MKYENDESTDYRNSFVVMCVIMKLSREYLILDNLSI